MYVVHFQRVNGRYGTTEEMPYREALDKMREMNRRRRIDGAWRPVPA